MDLNFFLICAETFLIDVNQHEYFDFDIKGMLAKKL